MGLSELNKLLDFMEENIDLDHLREIEELHYDTIKYRDVERLPLTIHTVCDGYRQIPLDIAYRDPEKMLYNEILWSTSHSSYNSVRMKDDGPLMVRSNHGIGIIASLFGCKLLFSENQLPWVEHISVEKAKKIFAKGVPDFNQALGKRVIETYQYYRDRLAPYPKCSQAIRITQPDMPGPYDIFHLIVGNEAFILPYDHPELAKYMIGVITATFIAFRKYIEPYLTDSIHGDAVFVKGFCTGGKVLIKADIGTANLSPEMYQLYEGEPDKQIMKAFEEEGGGSLHYCGGSKNWHHTKIFNHNLRCINFGNPEMHELQAEYTYLKEKKIAIVGWGRNQSYQHIRENVETGDSGAPIRTGLTLMCEAADIKQGKEVLNRHKEICAMRKAVS